VRFPEPAECATTSRALLLPVEPAWSAATGWTFDARVPVARGGQLSLALVAPGASAWHLRVPDLDAARVTRRGQSLDEEMPGWSVERFDVEGADAGTLDLRVTMPGASVTSRPSPGWLVVRDAAPIVIAAGTSTLATLSENEIGIVAHVHEADVAPPAPVLRDVARAGYVVLQTRSGTQRLALHDDGLHADGAAADGVFGALLPRWTSGDVRARVELEGVTTEGHPFARSVQLDFPILERRTALSGTVVARMEDAQRLRIELGAQALGPRAQLHVSAEVWGTDEHGELVPVCWLSRMLVPEERDAEWKLPLFLDARWLDVARASHPLVLRRVRVQDPRTHVPYDLADGLPIPAIRMPRGRAPQIVTSAMLAAPIAQPTLGGSSTSIVPPPFHRTLLLVHGYCSGGSIWPAADFTQPKQEFLDPSQNRTHDEFAQLMLQRTAGRNSFGVVAHSQGGAAALHLLTYYVSGLDASYGGRRIQSLATPYQGTPLASLGGFSCGVNNDMTPAGSAMWLAGIPTWARNEVWYYTTSDAGSACNFLTGLILTNPEDGTVEQFRGQLPGANNMGHVTGWCHTTGMTYPASYTDHARNAVMNANAAR
jgi:hypothetical protein